MRKFAYLMVISVITSLLFATAQPKASANLNRFEDGTPEELAFAQSQSLGYLQQRVGEHGISSVDDLQLERVFVDELSMAHTAVQQTFEGVAVLGGEAIVHLNPDGSLFGITDSLVSNVAVDTIPTLTGQDAINKAIARYGCGDCLTAEPEVEMWIMRRKGRDRLVYRVQLRREDGTDETAMPVYFIDAHTGKKVWNYDNLQTASGSSLYSGTVTFNTYFKSSNSTYYLEDLVRRVGCFDQRNTTSSTYRFTDTNNVWDSSSQRAGVDAHYGAAKVYDYYKNVHGRSGINGSGGPANQTAADGVTGLITSKVHYGTNYNNAFWNGSYMTYGDGDGSTFSPLVTLDIAGHEMTHGVTSSTAKLMYSNESGALNESWSDVFGAMVERHVRGESGDTWKIGEQAYTPATAGDALRYMNDTHRRNHPDHYSEKLVTTSDNGGVHTNSGISNFAFYLLAKGGTHHKGGSMTGIGADAAAKIWYKALTTYMTSSTNFKGARTATLNAAAALYGSGSTNYNAVAQAWTLCGVN